MALFMRDHPAWRPYHFGATRVMRAGSCTWLLSWTPGDDTVHAASADEEAPHSAPPQSDMIIPPASGVTGPLGKALTDRGAVLRVPNCDLWDALGTAITPYIIHVHDPLKTRPS